MNLNGLVLRILLLSIASLIEAYVKAKEKFDC